MLPIRLSLEEAPNKSFDKLGTNGKRILIGMALLFAACSVVADQPVALRYPVCEPSAALVVPCIDKPGSCLLVGDNETTDTVFLYSFAEGGLDVGSMQRIRLDNKGVDDIESMAKLDERTVLLLGSHSRNSLCKIRASRRKLMLVQEWGKSPTLQGSVSLTPEVSAAALLDGKVASSPVLQAVGAAIDRAEAQADSAAK